MRQFKLIFLLSFLSSTLFSNTRFIEIKFLDQWENILSVSKKSELPILLVCYNENDDLKFFNNKEIKMTLKENFIPVRTPSNSQFATTYCEMLGLKSFPLATVVNSNEVALAVLEPISKDSDLDSWLHHSMTLFKRYPSLLQKYKSNSLTKEERLDFVMIQHYNMGYTLTYKDAQGLILELEDQDLFDQRYWPFIYQYGVDIYTTIFKTISIKKEEITKKSPTFNWNTFYRNAYNLNLNLCHKPSGFYEN